MEGGMADTLDGLCKELNIEREVILSPKRDKQTASKRRVAILFFRLKGKSSLWIEKYLKRDHSVVFHAIDTATDEERGLACALVRNYITAEGGEPDDIKIDSIRRKIKIKVPNYKKGTIEEKEIFADEYKPKFTVLPWRGR